MREQQPLIQDYVDLLMNRLGEVAVRGFKGESQDMVEWFNWTTFDLIGDLSFGESFGCLEKRRGHEWIGGVIGNIKFVLISGLLRMYKCMFLAGMFLPEGLQERSLMNFRCVFEYTCMAYTD